MRYTMPAGSRYFKITLDFDYIWEQPLHKTTYSPFLTYIRLIDDNTQADITLTNGATSQTTLGVCPPPPPPGRHRRCSLRDAPRPATCRRPLAWSH